jgi:hypothetical protein
MSGHGSKTTLGFWNRFGNAENRSYRENSMRRLQIAKLFFRKAGLLEDLPKSSRRQSTRVHGHVGLAAIGVSKDFMAAALSYFYKSGAQELGENFTGGIRHRGYRRGRLATWLRPESSPLFLNPRLNQLLSRSDGSFDSLTVSR